MKLVDDRGVALAVSAAVVVAVSMVVGLVVLVAGSACEGSSDGALWSSAEPGAALTALARLRTDDQELLQNLCLFVRRRTSRRLRRRATLASLGPPHRTLRLTSGSRPRIAAQQGIRSGTNPDAIQASRAARVSRVALGVARGFRQPDTRRVGLLDAH